MPNLNGGHLFIRCLKQEGVKRVFTIVGDTILPLVDAAADEGIEFIDTRHEGAAMHMADGYARITGEPTVAMFTGGPGYSNAISALPAIYTSESPVIFVAGCAELPEKGMTTFQEIDQISMAAPVTKGSWLIHDKNHETHESAIHYEQLGQQNRARIGRHFTITAMVDRYAKLYSQLLASS